MPTKTTPCSPTKSDQNLRILTPTKRIDVVNGLVLWLGLLDLVGDGLDLLLGGRWKLEQARLMRWKKESCARQWWNVKEREVRLSTEEREKTINILYAHATVTVHICMITVAIVYFYTSLHPLMWVFFYPNCVKWALFFILHNFISTDIIALIWMFFWIKICISQYFFYFAQFYTYRCKRWAWSLRPVLHSFCLKKWYFWWIGM